MSKEEVQKEIRRIIEVNQNDIESLIRDSEDYILYDKAEIWKTKEHTNEKK